MKWCGKYEIQGHDTDFQGMGRASSVVEYMQEAARKHLDVCDSALEELENNSAVFVLCRLTLGYHASVKVNDIVSIETWPGITRGVSYPRYTKMYKDSQTVAELSTVWTTINTETRRIIKLGDILSGVAEAETLSMEVSPRMRIPQTADLLLSGQYKVGYWVCDTNGHMNNVRYIDMFCDHLNEGLKSKRITNIDITYVNEAPMGEVLKIYASRQGDDGKYYLRAIRSDGKTCSEAEFTVKEL